MINLMKPRPANRDKNSNISSIVIARETLLNKSEGYSIVYSFYFRSKFNKNKRKRGRNYLTTYSIVNFY